MSEKQITDEQNEKMKRMLRYWADEFVKMVDDDEFIKMAALHYRVKHA